MAKKSLKMTDILESGKCADNASLGLLSRLWRRLCYLKKITPGDWEVLIRLWQNNLEKTLEKSAATIMKNNASKVLVNPDMTWRNFLIGIDVITARGNYKRVRFEVHLVPKEEGPTEVYGIDVVDESNNIDSKILELSEQTGCGILRPDDIVDPHTDYIMADFDNDAVNSLSLRYIGEERRKVHRSEFDEYSMVGHYLIDKNNSISVDWAYNFITKKV